MNRFIKFSKAMPLVFTFLFFFSITALIPAKSLAFVATGADLLGNSEAMASFDRAGDLDRINSIIAQDEVKDKLMTMGYSEEEIQDKLSSLTDEEINHLASSLDSVQSGSGVMGTLIGILIIVALVLLILHLMGHDVIVINK